jgi:hypothetical protein
MSGIAGRTGYRGKRRCLRGCEVNMFKHLAAVLAEVQPSCIACSIAPFSASLMRVRPPGFPLRVDPGCRPEWNRLPCSHSSISHQAPPAIARRPGGRSIVYLPCFPIRQWPPRWRLDAHAHANSRRRWFCNAEPAISGVAIR